MNQLATRVLITLLTLVALGYTQPSLDTGQISGVVQGPDGIPVSGALVVVSSQSAPGAAPFNGKVLTGVDGTFHLTNVPAGTFAVCPYVRRNEDLLSPCLYDARPTITLTAGQQGVLNPIQLAQGYRLRIHIDDSAGKYHQAIAAKKQVGLLVMVSVEGSLPIAAEEVRADFGGIDKEVVIPFDRDFEVLLGCHGVDITDEKGNALPRSDVQHGEGRDRYTPMVYRVNRGAAARVLRYAVVDVE